MVFTTPYVLRAASELDWTAYLDRALGAAKGDAGKSAAVLKHLPRGPARRASVAAPLQPEDAVVMGWRDRRWTPYQPRPKAAKLSAEQIGRMRDTAVRFVERSKVLGTLVERVELTRGRVYVWRDETDLMARITPLSSASFLLESQRRSGWSEHARGTLRVVLGALERDRFGGFHGLGTLARKSKTGDASVLVTLHRTFGIPLDVVAEPREWHALRRQPEIAEHDATRERVLVRFSAIGPFGSFGGTCLYALRDGEWGCYVIKPSAAASLATAEAWLNKRSWQAW